ncbi:MAG: hypothetical protein H0V17_24435 [Deltaproteobacteria bacterium]|nr:hypothetical protein [Deltaproteobacteria bacterium]
MRHVRHSTLLGVLLLLAFSCGGGKPQPQPIKPNPDPDVAKPDKPEVVPPKPEVTLLPAPPPKPDRPPEVFPPAWKKVGVGQQIYFSVAAIDQDLDETAVDVVAMPKSAKFDAITQMVTWKPTPDDLKATKGVFELAITQPGKPAVKATWELLVDRRAQAQPVAPEQSPMIETLLMIRQPKRLAQVNKDWPLDRMLQVGAEGFKWQFTEEQRTKLGAYKPDKAAMWNSFLVAQAQIHNNPRLDPKSDKFDKSVFGDPAAWKIVTVRPRIDRAWTELRVVYQAIKAPEPVFAMFRLRPTVEYVPALPRPAAERDANNKNFLGMVAKRLLVGGGPNPRFVKDTAAHGQAVSALMTDVMTFDDSAKAPYARGFMIGIALEAQMGGGSVRNADGSYKHGDAWAWSAQKPFVTADGRAQAYVNVIIPGFWTKTVPVDQVGPNGTLKTWGPACADKFVKGTPSHTPGHEVLCRKTLGFVDLPDTTGDKVKGARIDSNHLYKDYKTVEMQRGPFPLEDGRRDMGEENGMTCAQCHIRNFGMHDYSVPGNVDATKGDPKSMNKPIATLNFQIVPTTRWEEFTLEFLKHQECRGKNHLEEFLGPDAAKGFGCPLAK